MAGSMTRTQRVRRSLIGGAIVVGPALMVISHFLEPTVDWDNPESVVGAAVAQPTLWQWQHLMLFLGFMLLVPVAIGVGELVRRRHPALALTAVILVGSGAILIASVVLLDLTLAAVTAAEVSAVAAYYERTENLAAIQPLFPLFFGGMLGILLLAVGLWRSKAAPIWVPVLMAASILALFFAEDGIVADVAEVGLGLSFWGAAWAYLTNRPATADGAPAGGAPTDAAASTEFEAAP